MNKLLIFFIATAFSTICTTRSYGQIIIYPQANSILSETTVSFKWNIPSNTTNISFQISNDSIFNNVFYTLDTTKINTKTISNLNYNQKYFWRIGYSTTNNTPDTYSKTISFTVFKPDYITGLKLHLVSDSGITKDLNNKILQWKDLSTNQNHLQQTDTSLSPSLIENHYHGHNAVAFDGINDYMDFIEDIDLLNFTFIMVIKPSESITHNKLPRQTILAPITSDFPICWFCFGEITGDQTNETMNMCNLFSYPDQKISYATDTISNKYQTISFSLNNNTAGYKLNNLAISTNANYKGGGLDASIYRSMERIKRFGAYLNGTQTLNAKVLEVLIYSKKLSESEYQKITEYLSHKYQYGRASLGNDIISQHSLCDTTLRVNGKYASYNWSNGSNDSTITVNSGEYWVTVTDSLGFSSSDTILVDYPVANLRDTSLCINDSITLITNFNNNYNFLWSNGKTTPQINIATPGNYSVTISDTNGCSILSNIYSLQKLAYFEAPTICKNQTIQLIDESFVPHDDSIVNWLWNFGNGTTSTEQNPFISYTDTGNYTTTLEITTQNGCSFSYTDSIKVFTPQGNAETFELVFPMNNYHHYDSSISFNWTLSNNAIRYKLLISTDSLLTSNTITINLDTNYYQYQNFISGTNHYWTVLAYNACNDFISSDTNKIISTLPNAFNNMKLWLRADKDVMSFNNKVYQWNAQNSINKALQPTDSLRPILIDSAINNLPAINFDGEKTFIDLQTAINLNEFSIFIVFKPNNGINKNTPAQVLFGNAQSINTKCMIWLGIHGADLFDETISIGNLSSWPNHYLSYSTVEFDKNFHLLNLNLKDSTTSIKLNNAGQNIYETGYNDIHGLDASQNRSLTNLQRFGCWDNNNFFFDGQLAEIIIYNEHLNDSVKNLINAYLSNKYIGSPVFLGNDINIEYGYCPITIDAGSRFESYVWSTGDSSQTTQINSDGTYWVRATDAFGFVSSDTIKVTYPHAANTSITRCTAAPFYLSTGLGNHYTYQWNTGSTDTAIYVSQTGNYWVTISDTMSCGSITDTISYSVSNYYDVATLGPDKDFCKGNYLTLSGGASQTATYFWNNDSLTTESILIDTSGFYWVTAIDPYGCSITDTIYLNIIGNAGIANFSNLTSCQGAPTQFIDSSTIIQPNTITNWTWDFGDSQSSNEQNPLHAYQDAGNYTVSLTVTNDVGCENTMNQTIYVNPLPTINFAPDYGCEKEPVQFSSQCVAPNNETINYWNWTTNNQNQYIENPIFSYDTNGIFQVKLIAGSTIGCKDSLIKNIQINPKPIANFETISDCDGSRIAFIDKSETKFPAEIIEWQWDFGDQSLSNLQHPQHYFDTLGTYQTILIIQTVDGCSDTIIKPIQTNETQATAYFFADTFCVNSNAGLYDSSYVNNNTQISVYKWNINGEEISYQKNPNYTFTTSGNKTITLTITTDNNCTSSYTKEITIHDLPEANFTFEPEYGAAPLSVIFNNNTYNANAYIWDFGDTTNFNTEANPVHVYQNDGIYTISLYAESNFGCKDTTYGEIKVMNPILDIAIETMNYTLENNTLSINVLLRNLGTRNASDLIMYIDIQGGSMIYENFETTIYSGQDTNYHYNAVYALPEETTPSYICTRVAFQDGSIDDVPENNEQCITLEELFHFINPYPNPAKNNINIDFIAPYSDISKIQISDNLGHVLINEEFIAQEGINKKTYNTSKYKKGQYTCKIDFGGRFYTKQFLIK